MPEFKRTFTGGRMEKDLDERMVSNGLYREALNIEIATSEESDVGAAENILGNVQVSEATNGPDNKYVENTGGNRHIAFVVDQETGMLYRFISTECEGAGVWMDRVIEYDTTKTLKDTWDEKEAPVLIDIYKVRTKCTGYWRDECEQWWIRVYENFAQLRPFMAIIIPNSTIREDIYIQEIVYGSDPGTGAPFADLRMSAKFPDDLYVGCDGEDMHFVADRVLNFHPDRKITGINIMDGMIFWTDNYSEPKKINIKRSKLGCQYFLNPSLPSFAAYKYQHFDQHTRLIVNVNEVTGLGEEVIECMKYERECPIPGCTNPIAPNYNPNATVDDGSCIPIVYGCTDPLALNWNKDCSGAPVVANVDDGCCCYVAGCMDPTACNYNPNACVPDPNDPCYGISGCMDLLATNYNPAATCDDGSCNFLWSCSGTGYGVEGCTQSSFELTFLSQSSYTSAPHKAFEALVDGASHGTYASSFWWNQSIPSYVYSSTPGDPNYYGTQGDCIYPGPGGTWDKKIRLDKLTIGNFLPTSPADATGIANTTLKLFDETLHLGSCIGSGPSTEPEDKFLEYFYDTISNWVGCNWSYGGTTTSQYGSPWNALSPSFLEILQTRGFGDYDSLTSGAITKKVQVAVLSDTTAPGGSWEIVEGAVRLRLDKSSGYEWGVNLGGTPPDDITLTQPYDLIKSDGTITNSDTILKNWPPPKIDATWAWEDILRVLQSDWQQTHPFDVINIEGETFTFYKQEAPFTFDVEIQPTDCICTSWTTCACEKDPLNGVYTSEYDCQHDNMNYNSCCSQVNAPVVPLTGPIVINPLVTTTTTPPSGGGGSGGSSGGGGGSSGGGGGSGPTPGSLAEFMQVNGITLDVLHSMVHELGGPQTGESMGIGDEGERNKNNPYEKT